MIIPIKGYVGEFLDTDANAHLSITWTHDAPIELVNELRLREGLPELTARKASGARKHLRVEFHTFVSGRDPEVVDRLKKIFDP